MVDLPADHPARQRQEIDVPVPLGVEEEEVALEGDAAKEERERKKTTTLTCSAFLDQTQPLPLRLPDAAIERASSGLRPGDNQGAQVLRDVFGDALPWAEKELFRSK